MSTLMRSKLNTRRQWLLRMPKKRLLNWPMLIKRLRTIKRELWSKSLASKSKTLQVTARTLLSLSNLLPSNKRQNGKLNSQSSTSRKAKKRMKRRWWWRTSKRKTSNSINNSKKTNKPDVAVSLSKVETTGQVEVVPFKWLKIPLKRSVNRANFCHNWSIMRTSARSRWRKIWIVRRTWARGLRLAQLWEWKASTSRVWRSSDCRMSSKGTIWSSRVLTTIRTLINLWLTNNLVKTFP